MQLTYKGQRRFTTIYGGFISIFVVLGLAGAFFFQLYTHMYEPVFYNTAPSTRIVMQNTTDVDNLAVQNKTLKVSKGNTISVKFDLVQEPQTIIDKALRVRFYTAGLGENLTVVGTDFDAVWCQDLYAE